jgi:predicted DNA-binding ribbon-helix-helix protein
MKSQVVKRSIVIAGHKTSVSLEDAFWKGLKEIAATRNIPLSDLVSTIDNERQHGNLSSAIRFLIIIAARPALAKRRAGNTPPCARSRRICAPTEARLRRYWGVSSKGAAGRARGGGRGNIAPGGRARVTGGGSAGASCGCAAGADRLAPTLVPPGVPSWTAPA